MQHPERFPSNPGNYALILQLDRTATLPIGKLGLWEFPPGYYAYVGSAHGPGGLAGRLKRHLRPSNQKRPHWHLDSLSAAAPIIQIWWEESSAKNECSWARNLAESGSILVPGFGSSDCRCPSHLIWFPDHFDQPDHWSRVKNLLGKNPRMTPIESRRAN